MSKLTLLDMVQNILSSLEADEINSISDTPEGSQVAEIIKAVYFQMLPHASPPELDNAFFTLEGLSDTSHPNYLKLPDDVTELYWFKYDVQDVDSTQAEYKQLTYCSPQAFFEMLMARDSTLSTITEITSFDGVPLWIYNDQAPTYYTILEDQYIVCDAFDSGVDTTLQGSKTAAGGKLLPTFTIDDAFIPALDANLFPYLLAESKAVAMVEIKQTRSAKHEEISREQKIRNQNERHRFRARNAHNTSTEGPHYGRRRP